MTVRGANHDLEDVLRDLVLVVESQRQDLHFDEIEQSVRQLMAELKNLDVESVAFLATNEVPVGAKAVDPSSVEALLITLSATGGVITVVIQTVRDWLARQAVARRISVTIDGDTIVLEKGSTEERDALIDAYIRRHEVT